MPAVFFFQEETSSLIFKVRERLHSLSSEAFIFTTLNRKSLFSVLRSKQRAKNHEQFLKASPFFFFKHTLSLFVLWMMTQVFMEPF